MAQTNENQHTGNLRRDLGRLESYAILIGILIGAGIFQVISDTFKQTGPSGILGILLLAPAILTTSVAYAVFLSTPLGHEPGGEYSHISQTFDSKRLAFVGAWLKLISYFGAAAFLANSLAGYLLEFCSLLDLYHAGAGADTKWLAVFCLLFFYIVHSLGVRWIGRAQVWMCLLLGISIIILVVPGLFAIRIENYQPFFTQGISGFALSLPPLFFAFAGFESIAHAAGEVQDSTNRLPKIFLKGIAATTIIYLLIALVAFGVKPEGAIDSGRAPLAAVAAVYLPGGAAALVAVGGIMAAATSLNVSLIVPPRYAYMLAKDRSLPAWFASLHKRTSSPQRGLNLSLLIIGLLIVTDQIGLALNIAVFALFTLYGMHSYALIRLPQRNPKLYAKVQTKIPRWVQLTSAWLSVASMLSLVVVQVVQDCNKISNRFVSESQENYEITTIELFTIWVVIGLILFWITKRRGDGMADPEISEAKL